MQRNTRAKRHRQKMKSAKLLDVEGSGDQNNQIDSADSESESSHSSAVKSKGESQSSSVVPQHGLRDKSKLAPLPSVQECVNNLLDAADFMNSDASGKTSTST